MLYSVFPDFVNMSLTAAVVIGIVALLRPLLRRAPRAVTFLLWAVVLFRLICPVSFSADFSLLRGASTVDHRIRYIPTELVRDTLQIQNTPPAAVLTETVQEVASGAAGRTDFARLLLMFGTWGWLIGIFVFLAVGIVSLLRVQHNCIGAVHIGQNTYLADHIQIPFVIGVFRPRIYLPSNLTEAQAQHIRLHEEMHIRRGDPLWKFIAYLALALHWFNPLVWLGFHLFVRDMEAACDERVLSNMDENTRADYAETLLCVSTGRRFPSLTPAFGEDNPKTRIRSILRYKKPVTVITVIAVLFAAAIAVLLIVNPTAKTAPAVEVIPEFPECSGDFYNVSVCNTEDFSHGNGNLDFENYQMIYTFLQNMAVEVKPASESRAEDRDAAHTFGLEARKNDNDEDPVILAHFNFSSDFSRVWIDNGVKPSYTYVVDDPDAVQEIFTVLLTGKTENKVLDTAFRASQIADESEYITAIYCLEITGNTGEIQIGTLHADYASGYLCTRTWSKTAAPAEDPASPRSVEFVLQDDLRVQIWKYPRLGVIRDGEEEFWFKPGHSDYLEAVELVKTYSLSHEEVRQLLHPESADSAEPEATPSATEPESSAEVLKDTPQATPEPDSSYVENTSGSSQTDKESEILKEAAGESYKAEPAATPSPTDGTQTDVFTDQEKEALQEATGETYTDTPEATPEPTSTPKPGN